MRGTGDELPRRSASQVGPRVADLGVAKGEDEHLHSAGCEMSAIPLSRGVVSRPNAPSTTPGALDLLLDLMWERLGSRITVELAALLNPEPEEAERWHL